MNIGERLKRKIVVDYNEFHFGLSQICPNLSIIPEMIYEMNLDELISLVEQNLDEKYTGTTLSSSGYLMIEDKTNDWIKDLCGPDLMFSNSQDYSNETNQERLESLFYNLPQW